MTTISAQPDELETIEKFIKGTEVSDHIAAMEENIALAVGFTQRVGSLLNDAECDYAKVKMPVYDYECTSCGNVEEKVHSIAVLGIQQYCSVCNGRMNKLLSAPVIHVSKVEYRCPITNCGRYF